VFSLYYAGETAEDAKFYQAIGVKSVKATGTVAVKFKDNI